MKKDHLVTPEMLHNLPEPVQRYLTYARVVGKPWIRSEARFSMSDDILRSDSTEKRVVITAGTAAIVLPVLFAALGLYLYTLPGLRRLPKERRSSLDGVISIEDAVEACRRSGLENWDLVAYAQKLAARKFTYSRRNPWDTPARAFERGMGYCQQQALALKSIYDRLGIHSQPVYALKCRFPPRVVHGLPEAESISPHTWLSVTLYGGSRFVCPGSLTNKPGLVHFEVLSQVRPLSPWVRPFSHLGSVIENAKRDRSALRRSVARQGKV